MMTLKSKRASIWRMLESLESGRVDLLGPFLDAVCMLLTGISNGEALRPRLCPAYARVRMHIGHGHGKARGRSSFYL
jgi:hypothetical protein